MDPTCSIAHLGCGEGAGFAPPSEPRAPSEHPPTLPTPPSPAPSDIVSVLPDVDEPFSNHPLERMLSLQRLQAESPVVAEVKLGYLWKRSNARLRLGSRWVRRWYRMDHRRLVYSHAPTHLLDEPELQVFTGDTVRAEPTDFCIAKGNKVYGLTVISSHGETKTLYAETEPERDHWIYVVINNQPEPLLSRWQLDFDELLGYGAHSFVVQCTRVGKAPPGEPQGKAFAMKVSSGALLQDNHKRLGREVDILSALPHHSGIMRAHEVFQSDTRIYSVTDQCVGGDLIAKVASLETYTEGTVAVLMRQVLNALAALHARSIVHLDLKPENLLFKSDSPHSLQLQIIDFGLSAFEKMRTMPGGTAEYVPPEIALAPSKVLSHGCSSAADIWSAGILLYFMLSGFTPFEAPDTEQTLAAIRKGQWRWRGAQWTSVSMEAKALVHKMLTREPKSRPKATALLKSPWFKTHDPKHSTTATEAQRNMPRLAEAHRMISMLREALCNEETAMKDRSKAVKQKLNRHTPNRHTLNSSFRNVPTPAASLGQVSLHSMMSNLSGMSGHEAFCTSRTDLPSPRSATLHGAKYPSRQLSPQSSNLTSCLILFDGRTSFNASTYGDGNESGGKALRLRGVLAGPSDAPLADANEEAEKELVARLDSEVPAIDHRRMGATPQRVSMNNSALHVSNTNISQSWLTGVANETRQSERPAARKSIALRMSREDFPHGLEGEMQQSILETWPPAGTVADNRQWDSMVDAVLDARYSGRPEPARDHLSENNTVSVGSLGPHLHSEASTSYTVPALGGRAHASDQSSNLTHGLSGSPCMNSVLEMGEGASTIAASTPRMATTPMHQDTGMSEADWDRELELAGHIAEDESFIPTARASTSQLIDQQHCLADPGAGKRTVTSSMGQVPLYPQWASKRCMPGLGGPLSGKLETIGSTSDSEQHSSSTGTERISCVMNMSATSMKLGSEHRLSISNTIAHGAIEVAGSGGVEVASATAVNE